MIQRIQSIFLLLAASSAFSLLLGPMSLFLTPKATAGDLVDGIYHIMDNPILMTLVCVAGVLALANIFLF